MTDILPERVTLPAIGYDDLGGYEIVGYGFVGKELDNVRTPL
jgi:hypothetical protein